MQDKITINRILLNLKKSTISDTDDPTYLVIQKIYSELFELEKKNHKPEMQVKISKSDLSHMMKN